MERRESDRFSGPVGVDGAGQARALSYNSGPSEPLGAAPRYAAAQAGEETRCFLNFRAETLTGPNQTVVYEGIIGLVIGEDGAVDEGSLQTAAGDRWTLVGQVTGRSLRLRIALGGDEALYLTGSAAEPVDVCFGLFAGAFSGPTLEDVGTWEATGLGTA